MLDVAEARQKAWQQCAESAVALAAADLPAPDPRSEARDLVRALPARIRSVWKRLHWENSRKEVWWRLIQYGVVGAGGHGWAPKKGVGCLWLVAGPSCPPHSACSPAQGTCLLGVRWSARGQKGPAEAATAGGGATAQACLAAGAPCYRAAPPGVGGSVSGHLDGHGVGQLAAVPLL